MVKTQRSVKLLVSEPGLLEFIHTTSGKSDGLLQVPEEGSYYKIYVFYFVNSNISFVRYSFILIVIKNLT